MVMDTRALTALLTGQAGGSVLRMGGKYLDEKQEKTTEPIEKRPSTWLNVLVGGGSMLAAASGKIRSPSLSSFAMIAGSNAVIGMAETLLGEIETPTPVTSRRQVRSYVQRQGQVPPTQEVLIY